MALADLQKEAYRAVLRAVAATQLDWVRTDQQLCGRRFSDSTTSVLLKHILFGALQRS